MKIYQLHSDAFGGDVQITFNKNGVLVKYEVLNEAIDELRAKAIKLFISEDGFLEVAKQFKVPFTIVNRQINFDMFWERYAYKVNKPLAIAQWNKLNATEQLDAFDFIPHYFSQLKMSNTAKKYAVRYLKHRPWVQ